MKRETANGQDLREMFTAAVNWLEKSVSDIDALNVFPVPDGDCGTNMLLTMRSGLEEAYRAPDRDVSAVARAMAKGTLLGARGNSGVILSQIWRGIAESLSEKDSFTGSDLANALLQATSTAYKGLSNPVEGTILTVVRESADAARAQATTEDNDVTSVLEASVAAAKESVANTPALLPALKEAGVVDAGGQGLFTLLEGALQYLEGEAQKMQFRKPQIVASNIPLTGRRPDMIAADEEPFGYCTEFMLKGEGLDPEKIREKLQKNGESLIVVGNGDAVRIHIHTLDPGNVIHYIGSMGTLHKVSIRNMDEQHEDYLQMQRERMPEMDMATVAIVPGDGLRDVFRSLGVTEVVSGGQTMNPSTKEILEAVESVPSDKVIILPNNKNIILTAGQVQSLTKKTVEVIPTETIPQGIASLLATDYESDLDTNVQLMKKAKSAVRSVEITRAVRSAKLDGLSVKKKQAIGFLDGGLVAVGDNTADVLYDTLSKVDLKTAEIVTLYYGADTKSEEAEQAGRVIREKYPQLQVEVMNGGQPHYDYIVSIE